MRKQILIVDDDPAIRNLIRLVAERRGFSVDVACDGLEAIQRLGENRYDLAIIDLMMPRLNGYDLVREMRAQQYRPTVVVATAMTDENISGLDPTVVHSVIRKPFDIEMVSSLMAGIIAGVNPPGPAPQPAEIDVPPESRAPLPPSC
jgi:DNA-binding response OmpR family regulator